MTDPRDDLRATEQAIVQDATTIGRLEQEKAALDPTDPEVGRLSGRVQALAGALKVKAVAESEIVAEIQSGTTRRN